MSNIKGSKLFRETVRILQRKLSVMENSELACCNISYAQCCALIEIGRMETISLSELAQILDLDSSTLSRTVNNLVTSGFALREADPSDRRYVTITLTDKGSEMFAGLESAMDEYFDQIFAQIPESKRGQILEDLIIVIEAMDKSECCLTPKA